ncbi:Aliphatic nitrilase [Neofusicoccum parvum]|nr:Aliphatic nitrilase [Neofusicoccum parvum]
MRASSLLLAGLSALHAYATNTTTPSNLTVALVRAPPANWPSPILNKNWTHHPFDLNATVAKATTLISRAAAAGAHLVVFPELWFPGYPKGIDAAWIASPAARAYIANSLVVGGPQWRALLAAAAASRVHVALAYSERGAAALHMGQALIAPNGTALVVRRKLRPSGIEREFWSDGEEEGLVVVETGGWGRWGMLECWEHFHPSMTFPMQAQLEDLHVASFPYMPGPADPAALSWESVEVNSAAARTYAVNSGAVTLFAAVGYSAVYDGTGVEVAAVAADVDFDEQPMLYASVNASAFRRQSYDVDGEQSWGVLQQVEAEFPAYIPRVKGEFTEKKTVLIADLLAGVEE